MEGRGVRFVGIARSCRSFRCPIGSQVTDLLLLLTSAYKFFVDF